MLYNEHHQPGMVSFTQFSRWCIMQVIILSGTVKYSLITIRLVQLIQPDAVAPQSTF